MTTNIYCKAELPHDLLQTWLQHVRDFDTAHPGCHFEVMYDGPEMPLADILKALQVSPALTFTEFFERKKAPASTGDTGAKKG